MKKLFASDFDGTFFGRRHIDFEKAKTKEDLIESGYLKGDIQAVLNFQKKGNLFGFCTGRSYESTMDFLPEEIRPDFVIANSGALLFDQNGNLVKKHIMNKRAAKALLKLLPKEGLSITTLDRFYVAKGMEFLSNNPAYIEEFDPDSDEEIVCISSNLHTLDNASEFKNKADKIPGLNVFQNRECLDITSDTCSKGTGVKDALDYFKINPNNGFGAGDSFNDLPLIEAVHTSFTFHDSPEILKEKANYIVSNIEEALSI